MSEENKDLGDKAKDAKESAKEFASEAKESAKEFVDDTKEAAKDFGQEAKKTANEFKEGLASAGGDNKKILAGCLIIGSFIVMAMAIIGLIEGIIYLTKSDEEFYNTYQVGKKPWF